MLSLLTINGITVSPVKPSVIFPCMGIIQNRAGFVVVEEGRDKTKHVHIIDIRTVAVQGRAITPVFFIPDAIA